MKLWTLILSAWEFLITILILQPPTNLDNSISYFWITWIFTGIISGGPDMKPEGSGFYVHGTMDRLDDPVCQLPVILNNGELTLTMRGSLVWVLYNH